MKYKGVALLLLFSVQIMGQYMPEELTHYEELHVDKQNGAVTPWREINRTFNATGVLVHEVISRWHDDFGRLIPSVERKFVYEGKLLRSTEEIWYSKGMPSGVNQAEYNYEKDCLIGQRETRYSSGELSRMKISNFANCQLKSESVFSREENKWILSEEKKFNYGEFISGEVAYRFENGLAVLHSSDYIQRDEFGNVIREETIDYDWNHSSTYFYEYDQRNNMIRKISFVGTANNLVEEKYYMETYEYDSENRISFKGNYIPSNYTDSMYLISDARFEYIFNEKDQVTEQKIVEHLTYNEINGHWVFIHFGTNYYKYYCDGLIRQKRYRSSRIPTYDIIENFYPKAGLPCANLEPKQVSVFIYPNPAHASITIRNQFLEFDDCLITIYDASGKVIQEDFFYPRINEAELDISHLAEGIYFIQLTSQDKMTQGKFIKL